MPVGCDGERRTPWLARWVIAFVVLVPIGYWLWQAVAFPGTADYRKLISTADQVEIRAFIVGHVEDGDDLVTLTDQGDLDLLASSIRITGPWLPVDELIANSYRIRAVRDGDTYDIVIRGGDRIRAGDVWHARIAPGVVGTIKTLVQTRGGHMPDWKRMTGWRDRDQ